METISQNGTTVDVICQHTREGTVIPIKIRVTDDNGEYQTYLIQAYKDVSSHGGSSTPDGIITTTNIMHFECKISVFNRERRIHLFYNTFDSKWKLYI